MAVLDPQNFEISDGRTLVIRSLRPEDAEEFPVFQQTVAHETNFTLQREGHSMPVETARANIEKAQLDPTEIRLAVFDGVRLVGLLGLHREFPGHPWLAHCLRFGMMVVKDFWGTGVAAKLLEAAEKHAKAHGIRRLEATVRTANPRGVAFYKKRGFEVEGTRRVAAVIDGVDHDELFIAKILS